MTDKAIMMGDYVDLKFMPGLKSARVFVDIPIEHSNAFLKMFDAPDRSNPVKVVIARIALPDAEQPSGPQGPATHSGPVYSDGMSSTQSNSTATEGKASDKPRTPKSRSQMAAIKCADLIFCNWLMDTYGDVWNSTFEFDQSIPTAADKTLKLILGISSKKELDIEGPKAEAWDKLLCDFEVRAYAR
jgi:hypothetical protein